MVTASSSFALDWASSEVIPPVLPPKATAVWTNDRNQLLINLWDQGLSAADIARQLHTTRNAILGKKFRLRLADRPNNGGTTGERKVRATQAKFSGPKTNLPSPRFSIHRGSESVAEPPPLENAVSLIDLDEVRHCRYPAGYDKDGLMMYCGAPRMLSADHSSHKGPYCHYHNFRCYNRNVR